MAAHIDATKGLKGRMAPLMNNRYLSDVQIMAQCPDKETCKRCLGGIESFFAHKLILGSSSPEFQRLLLDEDSTLQPDNLLVIKDCPRTVSMMLQYLYTDEVDINHVTDASCLLSLAKRYSIAEIAEDVGRYVEREMLSTGQLFQFYTKCLYCEGDESILRMCRRIACVDTSRVLASHGFLSVAPYVVKDIVKQDSLTVESESEVVEAVLKWAELELERERRSNPTVTLRTILEPLLPHLRLLSLSFEEFTELTKKFDVFTGPECSVLVVKIVNPDFKAAVLPPGFCQITKKRGGVFDEQKTCEEIDSTHIVNQVPSDPSSRARAVPSGNFNVMRLNANKRITVSSQPQSAHVDRRSAAKNEESSGSSNSRPNFPDSPPLNPRSLSHRIGESMDKDSLTIKVTRQSRLVSRESSPPTRERVTFGSLGCSAEAFVSGSNLKRPSPVVKVMPQPAMFQQRTFDFNLSLGMDERSRKDLSLAFSRYISSTLTIDMQRGSIALHGIELRVANSKTDGSEETLAVNCSVSKSFHKEFVLPLKNNVCSISFPQTVKLQPQGEVEIEVSVESLQPSRCSTLQQREVELNCGLNLSARLSLQSNLHNKPQNSIFFLISRLLYTT